MVVMTDEMLEGFLSKACKDSVDAIQRSEVFYGKKYLTLKQKIGIFTTSLRRYLCSYIRELDRLSLERKFFEKFCEVKNWVGVCVPKIETWSHWSNWDFASSYGFNWRCDPEKIKNLCSKVRDAFTMDVGVTTMAKNTETKDDDVDTSLKVLEIHLQGMNFSLTQMKDFNQRGDEIVDNLYNIIEGAK